MAQALVIYYSRTGNTRKMAEAIGDGLRKEGIDTGVKAVSDVKADELTRPDAIIIGSPTYYGTMAAEIKKLFDDSVQFHGKLDGKIGAAFASSANLAGGNETTIIDILSAMLIHGMLIQGDHQGSHYGPVAIGKPDDRALEECQRLSRRLAKLINKIS